MTSDGAAKPVPARYTSAASLDGIGAGGGSPDLNSQEGTDSRRLRAREATMYGVPYMTASASEPFAFTLRGFSPRELDLQVERECRKHFGECAWKIEEATCAPCMGTLGGRIRLYEARIGCDRRGRHLGLTGATRLGRRRSRRWPGRNRAARRRLASQISLLRRQPGIETAALTLARRAGADRSSAELWASRWLPAAGDEPDTRRFIIELWIVAPASVQALLNRCRPLSRWPQRLRPARGIETVLEARSRTEDPVDRTG